MSATAQARIALARLVDAYELSVDLAENEVGPEEVDAADQAARRASEKLDEALDALDARIAESDAEAIASREDRANAVAMLLRSQQRLRAVRRSMAPTSLRDRIAVAWRVLTGRPQVSPPALLPGEPDR